MAIGTNLERHNVRFHNCTSTEAFGTAKALEHDGVACHAKAHRVCMNVHSPLGRQSLS